MLVPMVYKWFRRLVTMVYVAFSDGLRWLLGNSSDGSLCLSQWFTNGFVA